MPKLLGSRLIPITRRVGAYLFNDTFTTTLAAGAINGTLAEPGPGSRTVVDANSKLTIASGDLTFATGGSANGNPGLWMAGGLQRSAGRLCLGSMTVTSGTMDLGWDDNQAGAPQDSVRLSSSATIRVNGTALTVGLASLSTNYLVAVALRATGAFYFIKNGIYTNWTMLWNSDLANYSTIYAGVMSVGTATVGICQYVRVPPDLWLPSPVASDGFSAWGTTNGLAHAEGATGIGGGGSGKSWTNQTGTFTASGGVANASALSGGIAIATLDCGKADVVISVKLTWLAGTGGLVVRYADANNYVQLRHTGTNLQLVKVIANVATTVLDAAATYSAGARILLVAAATKFRCFYNELAVSTEQTISDAAVQSPTLVGLRTSDTTNTFDDFLVYARGVGGEYSILDSF